MSDILSMHLTWLLHGQMTRSPPLTPLAHVTMFQKVDSWLGPWTLSPFWHTLLCPKMRQHTPHNLTDWGIDMHSEVMQTIVVWFRHWRQSQCCPNSLSYWFQNFYLQKASEDRTACCLDLIILIILTKTIKQHFERIPTADPSPKYQHSNTARSFAVVHSLILHHICNMTQHSNNCHHMALFPSPVSILTSFGFDILRTHSCHTRPGLSAGVHWWI